MSAHKTQEHSDCRKHLAQVARAAVEGLLTRGASGARARAGTVRNVSLTYREGRPDEIIESSQRRLTLWLYVDGRYSTCETNDITETATAPFLDKAMSLARAVEVDPHRQMTDPALYELTDDSKDMQESSLEVYDSAFDEISNEERHQYASSLETAARQLVDAKKIITVEAKYQDTVEDFVQVHSNGFEGALRGSQRWGIADVSLRDEGERKPSGWGLAASRKRQGLASPQEIARQAVEAATARLGATPIETATLPMVLENRAVSRLFRYLLAALDGRAIQQRSSFLDGRLGQTVGSPLLDVTDDPFLTGGFASRLFDGEGIAARRLPIFERGVLRNYYLSTYYAKKLDVAPTTASGSNVIITPGKGDLKELISDIERGILVRGFLGGNSNPTTGDFSLGVYGTLIEGGELTRAVAEMNIAGNQLELWQHLVRVGNDVYPYSTILAPSLRFEEVQFSGK